MPPNHCPWDKAVQFPGPYPRTSQPTASARAVSANVCSTPCREDFRPMHCCGRHGIVPTQSSSLPSKEPTLNSLLVSMRGAVISLMIEAQTRAPLPCNKVDTHVLKVMGSVLKLSANDCAIFLIKTGLPIRMVIRMISDMTKTVKQ